MSISRNLFTLLLGGILLCGLTGSAFAQNANILVEAATQSGNGIAEIPPFGATAFALSTTNVGGSQTVVVQATTNAPITVTLCQTNPQTAACLAPPSSSVTLNPFNAGAQPTFSVFLQSSVCIPHLTGGPQVVTVTFYSNGAIVGHISVPVENVPTCNPLN
jgi:hypothetical protein